MAVCGRDRLKNRIERYWNWRSASYELDLAKSIETVKNWESTIKGLVSHVRGKGLRALDVGTGPGQLAFYLAREGFEVTGIDISPGMIQRAGLKARELGLGVDFKTGDAEKLPYEDNTFDVVVTRNLVWTLPNPEVAVKEWRRVLKPGGRIIISDGYWRNTTWSRIHHLLLKTIKGFLKTRSLIPCRFFSHYASLIHTLPLYEGVTLKDAGRLMKKAGFQQVLSCDIRKHFGVNPYGESRYSPPPFFIVYGNK
ncbi:class I SAM-dependent methyltransferase [Desulfospira joergensenii]|uniref:class I SAM-dependent methyltransferase n=1 Tax=Desulfospira joergensenii TaxID=53329 RepID=UPI0003B34ECA|nr:class I SAM-dependent methyltransferase [Desulfospira joergensenii]